MKTTMILALLLLAGCTTIDNIDIDQVSLDVKEKVDNVSTKANEIYQGWKYGDGICEEADGENIQNSPEDCYFLTNQT